MKDIVTRAISGHATEGMQRLYSTVASREIEEAIGKVVSLANFRKAMAEGGEGARRGAHGSKTKKSVSRVNPN